MIRTNIEEYENYGRVLCVSDGTVDAKITLDIGPRVIYLARKGKKNVFFNDLLRRTCCNKPEMDEYYGKGRCWYLYGGYRLWLSPEGLPHTYYPDNDPVNYEIDGDTVTFTPPAQTENGLATGYSLTFKGNGEIGVRNFIKNTSGKVKEGAVWTLAVMSQRSHTFGAQSVRDTGLLPNRTLVIWPYTDIHDGRIRIENGLADVRQDPDGKGALKIGFNNELGRIMTLTADGQLFTQTFDTDHINGVYPDGGCSSEIYSCPDFTEAEALSPLTAIAPGDEAVFELNWTLSECTVDAADMKALEELIRG